jgi:hypothetical protein
MKTVFRFHPSSVGNLMAAPKSIDLTLLDDDLRALYRKKSKTEADQEILRPYWERTLSEGAKTYVKSIAREFLYGYRRELDTRCIEKGHRCEPDSIDLFNLVNFTRHQKNTERRVNDWLTGECDTYVPGVETIDWKTCWSLDSFPMLAEDAHSAMYEWQGVAYGILWPDVQRHKVVFCMVDTPEDLIKWDDVSAHQVSHIDPALRVTCIEYPKDPEKERLLEVKCGVAHQYLMDVIVRIRGEKGIEQLLAEIAETAPPAPAADWKTEFLNA